MEHPTDFEALMRQSLAGDAPAYAELLRESARMLRPFLSNRIASESEVDDLLQEVLISIHKARHTYDGNRPYKPWVFAIAKFRLRDHLRMHYSDKLRHAEDIAGMENILREDVTEAAVDYETISGELRHLSETQATILRLMHHDGYTAREVAEKLNMTLSAVKVAAHRAYKVLKQRLQR
jgi:RNA polymerase sigma-70 factor (ECF subfamily)